MRLVFTKGAGKHDRLDIFRDGACISQVVCPKQGIIPHDMIHFAVEATLQHRGFITRALDGETGGWRMASSTESDGVERLVEVLQADGWAGWQSEPSALLDLYLTTCDARRCPPLPLQEIDLLAVRERIGQLSEAWQQVAVGATLAVSF
ncbi:MAG: hypothetical protein KJS95_00310 [Gammaproteobacteria bacterium]|nr:hypothetical protein [Gammaproteobacteria bacterium]